MVRKKLEEELQVIEDEMESLREAMEKKSIDAELFLRNAKIWLDREKGTAEGEEKLGRFN